MHVAHSQFIYKAGPSVTAKHIWNMREVKQRAWLSNVLILAFLANWVPYLSNHGCSAELWTEKHQTFCGEMGTETDSPDMGIHPTPFTLNHTLADRSMGK